MDSQINTTTTLAKDEELITRVIKKNTYPTPPFYCLGKSGTRYFHNKETNSKASVTGMDVMSILRDLSASATWLFWTLVISTNTTTNISHLRASSLSNCELNKLKKSYKELKALQLVIRVKPEYYLINPKAIIPYHEDYPSIQLRWNNLINP